jgi:hypothetical protein
MYLRDAREEAIENEKGLDRKLYSFFHSKGSNSVSRHVTDTRKAGSPRYGGKGFKT